MRYGTGEEIMRILLLLYYLAFGNRIQREEGDGVEPETNVETSSVVNGTLSESEITAKINLTTIATPISVTASPNSTNAQVLTTASVNSENKLTVATTREAPTTEPPSDDYEDPIYAEEEEIQMVHPVDVDDPVDDTLKEPMEKQHNVGAKFVGALFIIILVVFSGILFVRWRRRRETQEAQRYLNTANFNNPVAFPHMNYTDDPL